MIQFANVCGCAESSGETHLDVTLEVPDHRYEDEEFIYAEEDSPTSQVFEEFTGEYLADETQEERWCGLMSLPQ